MSGSGQSPGCAPMFQVTVGFRTTPGHVVFRAHTRSEEGSHSTKFPSFSRLKNIHCSCAAHLFVSLLVKGCLHLPTIVSTAAVGKGSMISMALPPVLLDLYLEAGLLDCAGLARFISLTAFILFSEAFVLLCIPLTFQRPEFLPLLHTLLIFHCFNRIHANG